MSSYLSYFSGTPTVDLFLLAGFLLLGGALFPFFLRRYQTASHLCGMLFSTSGSLLGVFSSITSLVATAPSSISIPWATGGVDLSLNIDGLAAFFLLPIFVLSFSAALYGYSYLKHDVHQSTKIAFHWFSFNILLLSMAAVVTAGNGLQFLISWEGMSISSFFLVCYDFENEEVCRAGWLYFMATHLGVAFLFFFFLSAAALSGSLNFADFTAISALSPALTGGLFILILVGFGSKAGLFPMHVWLPEAHPSAPSHVSALMSGVMIKTAVYGFLRMLTFLPPLPEWCVVVIIALGLIGAVFGISMTASQNDIKRSLAYSTVENINLIFLGIGLWLFAVNGGFPVMAALALTGTLLHVWNHALFKGLLFMGAGSVLHATGSRQFSHYGGLLRRMPFSGAMIILGSAAIAGLPPFNGFISELYLYMSVVAMGQHSSGMAAFSAVLILSLMILVGGLVLFVVCRLSGIALLGEPRGPEAAAAKESGPLMLTAMAILLALCVLIGVAPTLPLSVIGQPLRVLSIAPESSLAMLPFLFQKEWTVCALLFLLLSVFFIWYRSRGMARQFRPSTWGCGFQKPNRRMVYSAGGFSQLAQDTLFCSPLLPTNSKATSTSLIMEPVTFIQKISDPVFLHIFLPFFRMISNRANRLHKLQAGRLNIYLLYTFIATILLLGLDAYQNLRLP